MNEKQIKILKWLFDNDDNGESLHTYSELVEGTRFTRKQLHREITRLRHLGYIYYGSAWDYEEEGALRGSGFMIAPEKRVEVEKLV